MSDTTPISIKERICSFAGAIQVKELASILGVSEAMIYKQARNGFIPNFRIGSTVLFDPREVYEWYERQTISAR